MFLRNERKEYHEQCVGVDIGTTSLKVVALDGVRGDRPRVAGYGIGELRHYTEQSEKVSSYEHGARDIMVGALMRTIERAGVVSRDVVCVIPPSATHHAACIDLPKDEVGGYGKRMVHEIERAIPFPVTEVMFEWVNVGEWSDPQGRALERFLVLATLHRDRAWYEEIITRAGLRMQGTYFSARALARVMQSHQAPHMIIDYGAQATSIIMMRGGELELFDRVNIGGGALTIAIAKGLGLSLARAEEMKRERGLRVGEGERDFSGIIRASLDIICNEMRKACADYMKRYEVPCNTFSLVGGGSLLKGASDYMASETGMTYMSYAMFDTVSSPEELKPLCESLVPHLAPAFSAAYSCFLKSNTV